MITSRLLIGTNANDLQTPENWNELSAAQFAEIAHLKCTTSDRKELVLRVLMTIFDTHRNLLLQLAALFWREKQYAASFDLFCLWLLNRPRHVWRFVPFDDVVSALPAIDYLFEENTGQEVSHLKTIKLGNRTYNGPRIRLNGLLWKQVQLADRICGKYAETRHRQWLTELAAVLYVEDGQSFCTTDHSIDNRKAAFEKLPDAVLHTAYVNYVHLRESFYRSFKLPQSELKTSGMPDWEAVTLSVAENGSLGPFANVEMTEARVVMKFFEKKHAENRPKK